MNITNKENFNKVVVLMGGDSAERNISLESGKSVHKALCSMGIDSYLIDFNKNSFKEILDENYDRAFIVLHGRGGEDGSIQGLLDSIGIPYTGSNVLGSALAMDKLKSKALWENRGLPTPKSYELSSSTNWTQVINKLGLPLMVKPAREGSSFGASKVDNEEELQEAWCKASKFDDLVMAESWITGDEYTISMLDDCILPIIKLETKRDFYDYQAKYEDDDTRYICPCGLSDSFEKDLGKMALRACKVLGVSGWGRVDILVDKDKKPWLIEVNTIPGMTSHSLVPMAAKKAGLSFEKLVLKVLATSFIPEARKQ